MKSLPQRLAYLSGMPAYVFAIMVVIAALSWPLFTGSQARLIDGDTAANMPDRPHFKQSKREAESPSLSIGDIKKTRADRAEATSANRDITSISISSAGWQPGESVEVSIYQEGAGVPDATFNLVANERGTLINIKLMLQDATNGLRYMTAMGRESEKFVTTKFGILTPSGGPFVNTHESTCTTFQTSFILGDTVCAQVTGINPKAFPARFDWIDPDGIVQEMGPIIIADGQTDTFMIPVAGPNAKVGTWRVQITNTNDNTNLASQNFIVTTGGPQPEMIATFASDCDAAQSSFIGGTTVCARVTGIDAGEENTFRIDWIRPDSSVAEMGPIVTMNNQTDTFAIPAAGPGGTWTVQLIRISDGGVQAQANFDVTVLSCSIFCPDNKTVSNDPGVCGAIVTYDPPFTQGDCGTVSCSPASGSSFPLGTTTVTCTFSVGQSCTFTITVNDTQAPSILCPANITQAADPNLCTTVVNYPAPTVSDNCPCGGNGTGKTAPSGNGNCPVVCTPSSGLTFPVGTTTVTCTATDEIGNTAMCSFTVTVTDTQPPAITCPKNITQTNDPNQCGAVVTFITPTPTDNCPGATATCSPATGSFFPVGTTTVTCTATDASPNSPDGTCSFTVTVNDTQAPTITCPANQTVSNTPNQCGAVVNYPPPVTSDNCPGVTSSCSPASGSFFPVGTTTVTCTAMDTSANSPNSTCSFTVTVNDTQPPTITCPPNQTAVTGICGGSSQVVTYPPPTAFDNCSAVTVTCVPPSGSTFPVGTTTVTCTATDTLGNTATCSFIVTLFNACAQDDSNPSIVLVWNTITGVYRFCCNGTIYNGTGVVSNKGNIHTINHTSSDRRVSGKVDCATRRGEGAVQSPSGNLLCSISDRDISNNSCSCGVPVNSASK